MHKKINSFLIPLITLALVLCFAFTKDKELSEKENRYLTTAPEFSLEKIADGSYMEKLEDWLCDQFPLRDIWIAINTNVSRILGKTEINGVYFAQNKYLIEKYESASGLSKIPKVVERFNDNLGEYKDNISVKFMAVPTSISINEDLLPKGVEKGVQLEDYNTLKEELGESFVDTYDALKEKNETVGVFYRLDHHWNNFGAITGAYTYLESMGYKESEDYWEKALSSTIDENECFELMSDSFKGTLYNKVGECFLGSDDIYKSLISTENLEVSSSDGSSSIYDESKLEGWDQYAYYLGGNTAWFTIKNTESTSGRKLAIIKDSYANSFVIYLTPYYDEITLFDPRFYSGEISEFVVENGYTEVLFLYNMNTLGTDTGIRSVK